MVVCAILSRDFARCENIFVSHFFREASRRTSLTWKGWEKFRGKKLTISQIPPDISRETAHYCYLAGSPTPLFCINLHFVIENVPRSYRMNFAENEITAQEFDTCP